MAVQPVSAIPAPSNANEDADADDCPLCLEANKATQIFVKFGCQHDVCEPCFRKMQVTYGEEIPCHACRKIVTGIQKQPPVEPFSPPQNQALVVPGAAQVFIPVSVPHNQRLYVHRELNILERFWTSLCDGIHNFFHAESWSNVRTAVRIFLLAAILAVVAILTHFLILYFI
jgi:hypothetical protein